MPLKAARRANPGFRLSKKVRQLERRRPRVQHLPVRLWSVQLALRRLLLHLFDLQ